MLPTSVVAAVSGAIAGAATSELVRFLRSYRQEKKSQSSEVQAWYNRVSTLLAGIETHLDHIEEEVSEETKSEMNRVGEDLYKLAKDAPPYVPDRTTAQVLDTAFVCTKVRAGPIKENYDIDYGETPPNESLPMWINRVQAQIPEEYSNAEEDSIYPR
mgnify:CR=1 FL=1